jgi:predicted phage terminase large subunit-like protein
MGGRPLHRFAVPLPIHDGEEKPSPDPTPAERVQTPALILHPHQTPPTRADDGGDWTTWLLLGGRGAGKTLAGASWIADQAEALKEGGHLALIGATHHDVRSVMIEGPSGILNLPRWRQPDGSWCGPRFHPSRRQLVFPDGCEARMFSAEDADGLRGPQFHAAWADEFCAWIGDEALAMARLGLRLGWPRRREPKTSVIPGLVPGTHHLGRDEDSAGGTDAGSPDEAAAMGGRDKPGHDGRVAAAEDKAWRPRLMVTTTPRPTRALKALMAEPGCAVTRAGTQANAEHLAAGFVEGLRRLYGGTRLAAQEIEGQVVDDGLSLWSAPMLAACRGAPPGDYERVVVGVDPSVTSHGHACGIVVAAQVGDRAYVLADRTVAGVSPDAWGRAVVQAAEDYGAQTVVAEVNQGGELVTGLLRAVGARMKLKAVRARVGKRARAEPVAALYEQGRVVHAGAGLEALEEALMDFDAVGPGQDRADALVWAITALMLGEPPLWPRIRWLG